MTLYGIETMWTYYGDMFRWYSKYNGARGPWCHHKEEAVAGGIEHEGVIKTLIYKVENPAIAQQAKECQPVEE